MRVIERIARRTDRGSVTANVERCYVVVSGVIDEVFASSRFAQLVKVPAVLFVRDVMVKDTLIFLVTLSRCEGRDERSRRRA